MLVRCLIALVIAAIGALLMVAVKPERVITREVGRAMLWGGVLFIAWQIAGNGREMLPR